MRPSARYVVAPPRFVRVTDGFAPLFRVNVSVAGFEGSGGAGFRLKNHNATAKLIRAVAAMNHANASRNRIANAAFTLEGTRWLAMPRLHATGDDLMKKALLVAAFLAMVSALPVLGQGRQGGAGSAAEQAAAEALEAARKPPIEDFKPSILNQPGRQYPEVNSERRVRARVVAPDAHDVAFELLGGVR
jgi:hypothetical protein